MFWLLSSLNCRNCCCNSSRSTVVPKRFFFTALCFVISLGVVVILAFVSFETVFIVIFLSLINVHGWYGWLRPSKATKNRDLLRNFPSTSIKYFLRDVFLLSAIQNGHNNNEMTLWWSVSILADFLHAKLHSFMLSVHVPCFTRHLCLCFCSLSAKIATLSNQRITIYYCKPERHCLLPKTVRGHECVWLSKTVYLAAMWRWFHRLHATRGTLIMLMTHAFA